MFGLKKIAQVIADKLDNLIQTIDDNSNVLLTLSEALTESSHKAGHYRGLHEGSKDRIRILEAESINKQATINSLRKELTEARTNADVMTTCYDNKKEECEKLESERDRYMVEAGENAKYKELYEGANQKMLDMAVDHALSKSEITQLKNEVEKLKGDLAEANKVKPNAIQSAPPAMPPQPVSAPPAMPPRIVPTITYAHDLEDGGSAADDGPQIIYAHDVAEQEAEAAAKVSGPEEGDKGRHAVKPGESMDNVPRSISRTAAKTGAFDEAEMAAHKAKRASRNSSRG